MAVKSDVTVPLSIAIASASSLVGNAITHWLTYGGDPQGFAAFRFFTGPAIVLLLVFIPAAIIFCLRLKEHGRTKVFIRRTAAYVWLVLATLVLGVLALIAFTGIDAMGYWMLGLLYFTPFAIGIALIIGIILMISALATFRALFPVEDP